MSVGKWSKEIYKVFTVKWHNPLVTLTNQVNRGSWAWSSVVRTPASLRTMDVLLCGLWTIHWGPWTPWGSCILSFVVHGHIFHARRLSSEFIEHVSERCDHSWSFCLIQLQRVLHLRLVMFLIPRYSGPGCGALLTQDIVNETFIVTGSFNSSFDETHALLNSSNGWCSRSLDPNQHLLVELGKKYWIQAKVVTKREFAYASIATQIAKVKIL